MFARTPVSLINSQIKCVAMILAAIFAFHSITPTSLGSPIPSMIVDSESTREADLATIQHALEQKVVQDRLEKLGFSKAEIEERLADATDQELHQMAIHAEELVAGGNSAGIVGILVVVLLVVLIIHLLRA